MKIYQMKVKLLDSNMNTYSIKTNSRPLHNPDHLLCSLCSLFVEEVKSKTSVVLQVSPISLLTPCRLTLNSMNSTRPQSTKSPLIVLKLDE